MKNCADCRYLREDKKKDGKVSGCCYYCTKIKEYVNGANSICDNFEKSYSRKYTTIEKIYKDGKDYWNNDTPLPLVLFILVVLIILGLIMGVFK